MNPGKKFDAVISVSGTETGLMLAPSPGQEMWRVKSANFLADQFYTEPASYDASRPEINIPVVQTDWRRGMGQEVYSDPYRYRSTIGCDTRFRGRVLLSGKKQGNTVANMTEATGSPHEAVAITNGNLETWSDASTPGTWTVSGTVAREGTTVHGGSYSCNLGNDAYIEQPVRQTAALQNKSITVSTWWYASGAAKTARVSLYNEQGTEVAFTQATAALSAWTEITLSYTADASSQESEWLKVRCTRITTADNLYVDDVTVTNAALTTPTFGTLTDHEQFNGKDYISDEKGIWEWVEGDSKYNHTAGSPRYVVDIEPFGDYLFMACKSGGTTREWWYYDKTNFFKATQANPQDKADLFKNVDGTLWKAWGANSVSSSTNPTTGSWGSAVLVGDSGFNIKGLENYGGIFYVTKENGLFTVVGSTVVEKSQALRSLYDTNSGLNPFAWQGFIYFPMGKQSLYRYDKDNDVFTEFGPAGFSPGMEDYSGQVKALTGDDAYLHVFVVGASGKIELLAGRYEVVGGATAWAWHPLLQMTASALNKAWITSLVANYKRLWWEDTEASVRYLRYMIIPDKYADPELATNYIFDASADGYFETGFFDYNFRDTDKLFRKLIIESENLTANIKIGVDYKKDDDASWAALGTVTASPIATLFFATASVIKGKKIKLRFFLQTNTDNTSPILISFALHATVLFTRLREFILPVVVEDNTVLRDGTTDSLSGRELEGRLRQALAAEYFTLKVLEVASGAKDAVSTSYFVRLMNDTSETLLDPPQPDSMGYGKRQWLLHCQQLDYA